MSKPRILKLQLVMSILVIGWLLLGPAGGPAGVELPVAQAARPDLHEAQLYFIENRGQVDPQVSYYLLSRDKTLYFTPTGVTLALNGAGTGLDGAERWTIKLGFVKGEARPVGQAQTETVVSYFRGPAGQDQTGLPTYARLVYPDLWPGIDLIYTLHDNQLKYQFVIQPGADPARIRLAYRGTTAVRLTDTGQLEVSSPVGSFVDQAPHAYQETGGRGVPVEAVYHLAEPAANGTVEYGFQLGAYDPTRPLVLDPAVILYAGFIGGTQRENGYSIAVDAEGSAYVTGETHSIGDFPAVVGPDLTHNGGPYNGDAFIAKVSADGTGLVYAGFIGGSGEDYGYGVAVDGAGNAYVTGETSSNDLPTSPGAYNTSYNGGRDAFVAKVNSSGTGLVYLTYIGDSVSSATSDIGRDIDIDSSGNAYILIDTDPGPFGNMDTSVIKLNAAGSSLLGYEYIGGLGDDKGDSLVVDAAGYAYATGETNSTNFSTTMGAYDTTYNGGGDAFVVKVDNDGIGLIYGTYIGDVVSLTTADSGGGIDVDDTGHAYVLVNTSFGPYGGYDTSVVKLNPAGSAIDYNYYLGGTDNDFGSDLALNADGHAYVTGNTASTDFPTADWPPTSFDAPQEAFVAQLNAAGSALVYAGFITGNGSGSAGIAVDSGGNAYVTGTNWHGGDFPATVGPDVSANGERDAFVMKIAHLRFRLFLPLILK